jgi:hypothetical protein
VSYAATTTVSVEKSRAEIERTLDRYGADAFGYTVDGPLVRIAFRMQSKHYRFSLTMPVKSEKRFTTYKRGYSENMRTAEAALALWEQACRQKWRALSLVIKAKLEAVEANISTLEDEFLAHMVLPSGETMGEWAKPQLEEAYRLGSMPKQLAITGPSS